jgi:hypothetical protein
LDVEIGCPAAHFPKGMPIHCQPRDEHLTSACVQASHVLLVLLRLRVDVGQAPRVHMATRVEAVEDLNHGGVGEQIGHGALRRPFVGEPTKVAIVVANAHLEIRINRLQASDESIPQDSAPINSTASTANPDGVRATKKPPDLAVARLRWGRRCACLAWSLWVWHANAATWLSIMSSIISPKFA